MLAQTCSSIGKTENEDSNIKTTSTTLNKLSAPDEDNKSSFKPYKLSDVTPTVRSTTSSLMTTSDRNSSPPSSSISSRVPPISSSSSSSDSEKSRCYTESSSDYPLKCHTASPPIPHLSGKGGGAPYIHHSHSHAHHRDHLDCVQCKTMRPQSDPLPIMNRNSVPGNPSLCQCHMCNQARDSYKCHYQGASSMPPLYQPSYKNPNLAPMITCRDPNCGNCSKFGGHSSIQNFLHPALVHQCTHNGSHKSGTYPVPPPPTNLTPYDSYLKGTPNPKPYVCNWVSEGKHCGNTFITSEELFQHLRTHTNAQQQQNHCEKPHSVIPPQSPSVPPATCNIHGCPCGANRKSSPGKGMSAYGIGPSPRYSPYSRMLPNGVNSHSYAPHSLFHY